MLDNYKIDEQWFEEDLIFERLAGVLPYKQGKHSEKEIEDELNKYRPSSVPNLVALTQFDIRKPVSEKGFYIYTML
jgi:hypothetical protein